MVAKGSKIALALVVVLMTWHSAWAQSGCTNAVTNLAPCLNLVPGNLTNPLSQCCVSLSGVVQTQPQCFCTMINGGGPMAGLAMNQTLALALSAACNVQTPPISQCNIASGPTASAISPPSAQVGSPTSDSTPSDDTPNTTTTSSQTTTPSSAGSKAVPSTTSSSSGTIKIKSSLPITMLLVFIVSVGTTRL